MTPLTKTVKENTGAIAAAFVVLAIVAYYLFITIPQQRDRQDNYYRERLNEFEKNLDKTLKDYTNQAGDIFTGTGYDQRKHFITRIYTDSLGVRKDSIFLRRVVEFYPTNNKDTLLHITNRRGTSITDVIERVKNGSQFPNWAIYSNIDYKNIKDSDHPDAFVINNGLDWRELDSLRLNSASGKYIQFEFSDKRFYRRTYTLPYTTRKFEIIGAIDKNYFENEARGTSSSGKLICTLIVILLFLSVPLLKPIISSRREKVTQLDLVSVTSCIGFGIIIISLYIFSTYLETVRELGINDELLEFSNKVANAFEKNLDTQIANVQTIENAAYRNMSDSLHIDLDTVVKKIGKNRPSQIPSVLFHFDKEARLTQEITHGKNFTPPSSFSDRDYVKALLDTSFGYRQALSAVYSRSTNKFMLIYAKRSNKKGSEIQGFGYVPDISIQNKTGFGYMLVTKECKPIYHSVREKRLSENPYNVMSHPAALLRVLRGEDSTYFDLEYNGKPCKFFAKAFIYNNTSQGRRSPIYLITYRDMSFEEDLRITGILNSFVIGLSYALGITLLVFLYSVVFNLGNLSPFSKSHIYWLLPDRSRKKEFKLLTWFNYVCFAFTLIMLFAQGRHAVFIAMAIGINIAFVNFILLSQRTVVFKSGQFYKTWLAIALGICMLICILLSWWLYTKENKAFLLSIMIVIHFGFILIVRNRTIKKQDQNPLETGETKKWKWYVPFITSVMHYHYLLVPSVIIITVYRVELGNYNNYNSSMELRAEAKEGSSPNWNLEKNFFSLTGLFEQPSKKILEANDFDNLRKVDNYYDVLPNLYNNAGSDDVIYLLLSLFLLVILIRMVVEYYARRFFLFQLTEFHIACGNRFDSRYFNKVSIQTPYTAEKLIQIKKNEEYGKQSESNCYTSMDFDAVPAYKSIELIHLQNAELNKKEYSYLWLGLSEMEKFVLADFCTDYFANYKNKDVMLKLIEKGLIVADPITGRLRPMNYSFRKFVLSKTRDENNQGEVQVQEQIKGTFERWRMPLIIIGISLLAALIYLYKEDFDKMLLVGGSVISTVTLLARFLNSYRK